VSLITFHFFLFLPLSLSCNDMKVREIASDPKGNRAKYIRRARIHMNRHLVFCGENRSGGPSIYSCGAIISKKLNGSKTKSSSTWWSPRVLCVCSSASC
jgi:hypothetical protein